MQKANWFCLKLIFTIQLNLILQFKDVSMCFMLLLPSPMNQVHLRFVCLTQSLLDMAWNCWKY